MNCNRISEIRWIYNKLPTFAVTAIVPAFFNGDFLAFLAGGFFGDFLAAAAGVVFLPEDCRFSCGDEPYTALAVWRKL